MESIQQFGKYTQLLYQALRSVVEFNTYKKNLFQEFVKIGYESIPIIILTGFFTGAVLTLQTAYQLDADFIPIYTIGSIVSKSIIIELATAISALVLAGKVGARIATELGTMRVSEQVDALESMGFNSAAFLILPRVFAGLFMFPMLYIVCATMGVAGGVIAGEVDGIITAGEFMRGAKMSFLPWDIIFGFIKSFVFGFVITSISCFKGYYATGGAEGVGTATTQATVYSCVFILLSDFALASILL